MGRDRTRDARRTFRVARMEDLEVRSGEPSTPDYEVPDDFDLSDLRGREAWELGDDEPLEAAGSAPLDRERAEALLGRLDRCLAAEPGDGTFRVADPRWIVRHVLRYGPDAEVMEPEWVRERIRARLAGMTG